MVRWFGRAGPARGCGYTENVFIGKDVLMGLGFDKLMQRVDEREAQSQGAFNRPLHGTSCQWRRDGSDWMMGGLQEWDGTVGIAVVWHQWQKKVGWKK